MNFFRPVFYLVHFHLAKTILGQTDKILGNESNYKIKKVILPNFVYTATLVEWV